MVIGSNYNYYLFHGLSTIPDSNGNMVYFFFLAGTPSTFLSFSPSAFQFCCLLDKQ